MLYKYRPEHEKVILGILTLTRRTEQVHYLPEELAWYADSKKRALYLWKDQFDNWAGVIGVEVTHHCLLVRKIILTPDAETYFNVFRILDNIRELYPNQPVIGTLQNQEVITRWERTTNE
ncbi:riboflavin biosynthesis protein RibT [Fructilactobacillus ixorae]|uniref:Riboflavin biosynthesis protein RibT n=1 Tax=Fructilactobacillus ixorae TaxID=1750535 RepID=A0ABY5C2F2_9LACO|nr:riboflavin biosynthesis protein RibT [Fructilactobacillus ixorae]USS92757.1 riboflavin biosynthesis protein RibT [Fructilactobacillus ixorae]